MNNKITAPNPTPELLLALAIAVENALIRADRKCIGSKLTRSISSNYDYNVCLHTLKRIATAYPDRFGCTDCDTTPAGVWHRITCPKYSAGVPITPD